MFPDDWPEPLVPNLVGIWALPPGQWKEALDEYKLPNYKSKYQRLVQHKYERAPSRLWTKHVLKALETLVGPMPRNCLARRMGIPAGELSRGLNEGEMMHWTLCRAVYNCTDNPRKFFETVGFPSRSDSHRDGWQRALTVFSELKNHKRTAPTDNLIHAWEWAMLNAVMNAPLQDVWFISCCIGEPNGPSQADLRHAILTDEAFRRLLWRVADAAEPLLASGPVRLYDSAKSLVADSATLGVAHYTVCAALVSVWNRWSEPWPYVAHGLTDFPTFVRK